MPKYEQTTIVDQIKVHQLRYLEVRFAVVSLVDGVQTACQYLRTTVSPDDDIEQIISEQNRGINNVFGGAIDGIDKDGKDFLATISTNVHTPTVKNRFKSIIRDKLNRRAVPTQRDWLTMAGAQFQSVAGTDRASIVNYVIIDRARVEHVNFGLVVCNGQHEVFNFLHDANIQPGGDAANLSLAMTAGIEAQFNHPPVSKEGTDIVENLSRDIHKPDVVLQYAHAFARWRDKIIERGLDPTKHRPEIDPSDGIMIAKGKLRTVMTLPEINIPEKADGTPNLTTRTGRGAEMFQQLVRNRN